MEKLRFEIVTAEALGPYVAGLRALEQGICYPIDDGADHFTIDHGAAYHPFFSGMGRARFYVLLDGARVVGTLAGVWRDVVAGGEALPAVYLADLKLAPAYRGRGVVKRLLWHALGRLATRPELRGWRLAYVAAMRGAAGDIMRSARGWHPARAARPLARFAVFFSDPRALASLPGAGAPPPPSSPGLDLSPREPDAPLLVSTGGRKDLRLGSTGAPWPLVHLPTGPTGWGEGGLGGYLQRCGAALLERRPGAIACFALDARLGAHIDWLRHHGVASDTVCTVHGLHLRWPGAPAARRLPWAHIATSQI